MIERLITFAEAAELVGPGVTARILRTWHEQGRLDAQRVGRTWRTTASKLADAVEKGWQSSPSTVPTVSTGHVPSPACGDMSGTSPGTKAAGGASVARAASLATAMAQNKRSLGSSLMLNGERQPAPVIHLKQG